MTLSLNLSRFSESLSILAHHDQALLYVSLASLDVPIVSLHGDNWGKVKLALQNVIPLGTAPDTEQQMSKRWEGVSFLIHA